MTRRVRIFLYLNAFIWLSVHSFSNFPATKLKLNKAIASIQLNSISSDSTTTISSEKPKWASGGIVSDIVNALIASPLFGLMKIAARKTLIDTAEKNGIAWRETAKKLEQMKSETIEKYYDAVTDQQVTFPSYYTQEFHAYEQGNLNWQAAFECESATMSMALRVWPKEELTAEMAQDRLRFSFIDAVKAYKPLEIKSIIDVGCSVGVSTFYLADSFRDAVNIHGTDLSPHFLAVARHRQLLSTNFKFANAGLSRISWSHQNAEKTNFPDSHFDLVAVCFMFHELPQKASDDILTELFRITSQGGMIAITDNNPKSPVIQGLPPALFTLMKSTEPWSDEYYVYDLESALARAGFVNVKTEATDPRHRTVMATRPANMM